MQPQPLKEPIFWIISYFKPFPLFIDIILIWLSSDTESAEAAEGAKDEKDAEAGGELAANNKEKVGEEAAINNNNNTKKSVTARLTITHKSSYLHVFISQILRPVDSDEEDGELEVEGEVRGDGVGGQGASAYLS